MTGTLISGNRSTLSRRSDTKPSTTVISDIIRMKTGLRSARRVSHMGGGPQCAPAPASRAAATAAANGSGPRAARTFMPSDSPSDAGDHHLVARVQARLHLEPVAAVDAQRDRPPLDDVAARSTTNANACLLLSTTAPTGMTGMCGCVSTTIAPRPYIPG